MKLEIEKHVEIRPPTPGWVIAACIGIAALIIITWAQSMAEHPYVTGTVTVAVIGSIMAAILLGKE